MDTALVIEVSNDRLALDRDLKGRIYARARVPEYWIANLREDCVERYTGPAGAGAEASYQSRTIFLRGDRVPLSVGGVDLDPVSVSDILP